RSTMRRENPPEAQRQTGARGVVCMSSYPPRAAELLRPGSRGARRLHTHLFVGYVETPDEAPDRIDAEAQRHLLENIERARALGAEVVRLRASDPVPALIDFARSHSVGLMLIGRSHQHGWRRLLGRTPDIRVVREAPDLDVQVVALGESGE